MFTWHRRKRIASPRVDAIEFCEKLRLARGKLVRGHGCDCGESVSDIPRVDACRCGFVPSVRICSMVVLVACGMDGMVALGDHIDAVARLDDFAAKAGDAHELVDPWLESESVEHDHVRIGEHAHVGGLRFEVVQIGPAARETGDPDRIAADFAHHVGDYHVRRHDGNRPR
jgi:hypothetical protein